MIISCIYKRYLEGKISLKRQVEHYGLFYRLPEGYLALLRENIITVAKTLLKYLNG